MSSQYVADNISPSSSSLPAILIHMNIHVQEKQHCIATHSTGHPIPSHPIPAACVCKCPIMLSILYCIRLTVAFRYSLFHTPPTVGTRGALSHAAICSSVRVSVCPMSLVKTRCILLYNTNRKYHAASRINRKWPKRQRSRRRRRFRSVR